MIPALAAALALSLQQAGAPGPEARSVPLERVFPFWTEYHGLPEDERSAFELDYQLSVRSGATASFWVETEGGYQVLERDETGAARPPAPDQFEAGRRLFTDAPEGGVSVAMRLSLAGDPATEYSIARLEQAIAQASGAMRSTMGLRALFMPRLDSVRFSFEGPAPDAVAMYPDGRETALTSVYGDEILVRPDDRALRGAVAVRFGRAPLIGVLETGG